MSQVSQLEGEISTITIFSNTAWFIPKEEEDYIYVKIEIEYLLELLGYKYQKTTNPKTLLVQKLNDEEIDSFNESFNGLKHSLKWIAFWSEIRIS